MCGSVRVNSHRLSIPETAQLKLESEIVRHPLASHGEDTERVQKQGERVLALDSCTTCRNLLHVVVWRDQHRYRIGDCQAQRRQPKSDCCRRHHRLREREWRAAFHDVNVRNRTSEAGDGNVLGTQILRAGTTANVGFP